MPETQSIFARYYSDEPFVDRYETHPDGAIDVIIPVLHSNELWRKNLISIYREVPVNRLLLGDAGCKDDTLVVAQHFPRVEIRDHSLFKSLGFSIKHLIQEVETDWFLYLHSDVYLPPGWFDIMRKHQSDYDWFGCPMRITALLDYPLDDRIRPYAGTQMGRKAAFIGGLDKIDDDYVYRQEDWVFAHLIEDRGFRHGRVEDTFHWHQMMPRIYGDDRRVRHFNRVKVDVQMTEEEEVFTADTQLRGTVKYLSPDSNQISGARDNFSYLKKKGMLDRKEFYRWVARTNPSWLPHLVEAPSGLQALSRRAAETMFPNARKGRSKWQSVDISPAATDNSKREEVHAELAFVKAVVQFMDPGQSQDLIPDLNESISKLVELDVWDGGKFANWVSKTNPMWSRYFVAEGQSVPRLEMGGEPVATSAAPVSGFVGRRDTILRLILRIFLLFFLVLGVASVRSILVPVYRVFAASLLPLVRLSGASRLLNGPRRLVHKFKSANAHVRDMTISECRGMAARFERLASQL